MFDHPRSLQVPSPTPSGHSQFLVPSPTISGHSKFPVRPPPVAPSFPSPRDQVCFANVSLRHTSVSPASLVSASASQRYTTPVQLSRHSLTRTSELVTPSSHRPWPPPAKPRSTSMLPRIDRTIPSPSRARHFFVVPVPVPFGQAQALQCVIRNFWPSAVASPTTLRLYVCSPRPCQRF
jgi:hypothetical protein